MKPYGNPVRWDGKGHLIALFFLVSGSWMQAQSDWRSSRQALYQREIQAQSTGAWTRLEGRMALLDSIARKDRVLALRLEPLAGDGGVGSPGGAGGAVLLASRRTVAPGWNRMRMLPPTGGESGGPGVPAEPGFWTVDGNVQAGDSVWVEPGSGGIYVEATGGGVSAGLFLALRSACGAPEPVPGPWPAADASAPFWLGTFAGTLPVTGDCFVHPSEDSVFDKPLIVVEGFDPALRGETPTWGSGDMNWEVLWNCGDAEIPNTESMPTLLDSLRGLGMDLVYLDFHDGTRAVEQQAVLLQELIRLCRDHKVGDFPMVVVGASMGGLVARCALREMELAGESHCTGLFIALDSPFRGAYLPVGMQRAIGFFAQHDAEAAALADALLSPAARTLLFTTPLGPSPEFSALQSVMQAQGLPQEPMCLAVVNSNGTSPFPMVPGPLYQGSQEWLGWEAAHVQINRSPGDPYHSASTPTESVLFDCELPNVGGDWWNDLYLSATESGPADAPVWEALPGSYSLHLASFREAMEAAGLETVQSQDATMFIPARSALDLPIFGGEALGTSPFDGFDLEPAGVATRGHCDVTNHLDFLWDWLGQAWVDPEGPGSGGRDWGWLAPTRRSMPAWTLHTGLQASIGAPAGNGFASPSAQPFEVVTGPCADTIRVAPGAVLHIGDPQGLGFGRLRVRAGTLLLVEPGATLHIHPGSALILEAGSECQAHGAAIHVGPGGVLESLAGSGLAFDSQPEIRLNGTDSRWRHAGIARVAAGQTLQTHAPSSGMGRMEWLGSQGRMVLEPGAQWNFTGDGPNVPGMSIAAFGTARFEGAGQDAHFFQTRIELGASANWFAETDLQATQVHAVGGPAAQIQTHGRLRWESGALHQLHLHHVHPSAASLFIRDCSIAQCDLEATQSGVRFLANACTMTSLQISSPSHSVRVEDCQWTGGAPGNSAQLQLEAANATAVPTHIERCTFASHGVGVRTAGLATRLGCNEFVQLGTALISQGPPAIDLVPGGNTFEDNDIHMRLIAAPWPAQAGGNTWGSCHQWLFYGSLDAPCPGQPQTLLLPASGNQWDGSTPGLPWQPSPIALQHLNAPCPVGNTNNASTSIVVKDLAAGLPKACTPGTTTESATPKARSNVQEPTLTPNPSEGWAQLALPHEWDPENIPIHCSVLNLAGGTLLQTWVHSPLHRFDGSTWPAGIYFVRLEQPQTGRRTTLALSIQR